MLPQDLHIHSTWSHGDDAVVPEQRIELIAAVRHARICGISDHFEHVVDCFDDYAAAVRAAGLLVGTEIDGHEWLSPALAVPCDYRIFHCRDRTADYRALEQLLATGAPVIVAHPNYFPTDLQRVPPECLVEINNRYVWRDDWQAFYGPWRERFRFVISSDAHQPHWLDQTIARYVAAQLDVVETLVFTPGETADASHA
ncbi:MAG: hypothetical protein EA400_09715 [Chromatiaceae bacterium]|nr:MAG: hypothetical protein EA400_09715 [Chromatiaceae bacterium]